MPPVALLVGSLVVSECNLGPEDATLSRMILDQAPTEEDYVATGHAELVARAESWAAEDLRIGWLPGTLQAADPRATRRSAAALVGAQLEETFFGLAMPRTYVFGSESLTAVLISYSSPGIVTTSWLCIYRSMIHQVSEILFSTKLK